MSTKMDEDDWKHTLAVFRACLPRRGRKAEDDRRFLEALHFFTVENVRWRALPERFGHWNSVWKRFDRLSKAGVFEAFFDTLASMSSTAHLLQMFNSTVALMYRRLEQKGARRPGARALAWRLHHENSRKIGRLRGYHRLRPDRRRSLRRASLRNPARYRARHSAPRRHLRQRLRQQGQPGRSESARHRSGHPAQGERKEQASLLRTHPLQSPRTHRAGRRTAQALQARRAPLRKDRTKLQINRQLRRRPLLDQIRPHGLNPRFQRRDLGKARQMSLPQLLLQGRPGGIRDSGTDTPLRIPYGNKDAALRLGARYRAGGWYAPADVELAAFGERGWL